MFPQNFLVIPNFQYIFSLMDILLTWAETSVGREHLIELLASFYNTAKECTGQLGNVQRRCSFNLQLSEHKIKLYFCHNKYWSSIIFTKCSSTVVLYLVLIFHKINSSWGWAQNKQCLCNTIILKVMGFSGETLSKWCQAMLTIFSYFHRNKKNTTFIDQLTMIN